MSPADKKENGITYFVTVEAFPSIWLFQHSPQNCNTFDVPKQLCVLVHLGSTHVADTF